MLLNRTRVYSRESLKNETRPVFAPSLRDWLRYAIAGKSASVKARS